MHARPSFRKQLFDAFAEKRLLVIPGAHDALSARLAQASGHECLFIGGFPVVGVRYGVPDIGLGGLGEISDAVRCIAGACDLPMLVDIDDGYGDVKNVVNTMHVYERMGVRAMFLEDQAWPKRCGHMTGKADAKVTVVEFGDFECPSCADAYQPMNDIIKQYSSNPNFNFVFREFPLSSIHPNADISAEAAEAAGEQGKFWDMHDLLYKNQGEWASSSNPITLFVKYAQQLGLDTNKFQTEVQAAKFANVIKADGDDGNAANVTATPTFFVNGTPYLGIPSQDMKDAIAKAIAAAK